jgi:hypothetical protein
MAKLETDREHDDSGANKDTYDALFGSLKPRLLQSVTSVRDGLQKAWEHGRTKLLRRVPVLPTRDSDRDMRLTMPHSRIHLVRILQLDYTFPAFEGTIPALPSDNELAKAPYLAALLRSLADDEQQTSWKDPESGWSVSVVNCRRDIITSSDRLRQYVSAAVPRYKGFPDLMSVCILSALDIWISIDILALRTCPLLRRFSLVLKPGSLDFLQLSTGAHLDRLQRIQSYFGNRWALCGENASSIFADPEPGCFAQCYLTEADEK